MAKTIWGQAGRAIARKVEESKKEKKAAQRHQNRMAAIEAESDAKIEQKRQSAMAKAKAEEYRMQQSARIKKEELQAKMNAEKESQRIVTIQKIRDITFDPSNILGIVKYLFYLQPFLESAIESKCFEDDVVISAYSKYKSGLAMLESVDPNNSAVGFHKDILYDFNKKKEEVLKKLAEDAAAKELTRQKLAEKQRLLSYQCANVSDGEAIELFKRFVQSAPDDKTLVLDALKTMKSRRDGIDYQTDKNQYRQAISKIFFPYCRRIRSTFADDPDIIPFVIKAEKRKKKIIIVVFISVVINIVFWVLLAMFLP